MGWLFNFNMTKRKYLIEDRIKEYDSRTSNCEKDNPMYWVTQCLKHCYKGGPGSGTLWKVMETKKYQKDTNTLLDAELWIGCDLLLWDSRDKCWGYRDMDESCGPEKVTCPLSYLKIVPPYDNDYARNWRECVEKYHSDRKPTFKLKVGQYVILKEGWSRRGPFLLTSLRPLMGDDGRPCKLPRKALLREVSREELDRAKQEWKDSIRRGVPKNRQEEMLSNIDDTAIRYKHDFLFTSIV